MADPGGAEHVLRGDHLPQDGRAVVAPADVVDGLASQERDSPRQVFVFAVPVAFDVADRDLLTAAAGEVPHLLRADPVRRRIEVSLGRLEVAAGRAGAGGHGGRDRSRRHIGLPHRFGAAQLAGELGRILSALGDDLHHPALHELRDVDAFPRDGGSREAPWARWRPPQRARGSRPPRGPNWERRLAMSNRARTSFSAPASGCAGFGSGEAGGGKRDRALVAQLRHHVVGRGRFRDLRAQEPRLRHPARPRALLRLRHLSSFGPREGAVAALPI